MRINSTNTDRLIFHGWVNKYPICVLLCKEQWKEKWDKHQTKSMRFWIGDKTSAKITKTYHNQMNSFHYSAMSMFASHCTVCTMTQNFAGSHKLKKKNGSRKRIWFFILVGIHVGLFFLLFLFLFIHYMCSSVVWAKL